MVPFFCSRNVVACSLAVMWRCSRAVRPSGRSWAEARRAVSGKLDADTTRYCLIAGYAASGNLSVLAKACSFPPCFSSSFLSLSHSHFYSLCLFCHCTFFLRRQRDKVSESARLVFIGLLGLNVQFGFPEPVSVSMSLEHLVSHFAGLVCLGWDFRLLIVH